MILACLLIAAGCLRIVDGDTVRIWHTWPTGEAVSMDQPSGEVRLRLWGIDASEEGEPGYDAATAALRALAADGLVCEQRPGRAGWDRR